MKNSEFLNLLEASGKLSEIWSLLGFSKEKVDASNLKIDIIYKELKKFGCYDTSFVDLIGCIINSDEEEIKNVRDYYNFLLSLFKEKESSRFIIDHLLGEEDIKDLSVIKYNRWFGEEIELNKRRLNLVVRFSRTDIENKVGRIVYKNVWYIEKDLKSNKVSVILRDKDKNIHHEKGKIKLLVG